MEPTTGIEPVNLILTKDVLYLLSYVGLLIIPKNYLPSGILIKQDVLGMERETGFDPATLSLEG